MNNYPKEIDGNIVWACCVSIINAGNCNHLRAREGRPLNGIEGECDKCDATYDIGSRENRCGDCGNCGNCCTHKEVA